MFKILIIIILGVGVGFALRQRFSIKIVSKVIMILIYMLLLILGIVVGANETIVSNIGTIGVKAAVISIAAVVGSMIMAKILYHLLYKGKGIEKDVKKNIDMEKNGGQYEG